MAFIKENNEYYVVDWEHWPALKKELAEANFKWSGNTPIHLTEDDVRQSNEIFVIRVYDLTNKLICQSAISSLTQDELNNAIYCLDDKLTAWLKKQWIKKGR